MDTADGGVDLGREQFAVPLVFAMAGPDIVAVDDPGDASMSTETSTRISIMPSRSSAPTQVAEAPS
jgi:hypothetical protein